MQNIFFLTVKFRAIWCYHYFWTLILSQQIAANNFLFNLLFPSSCTSLTIIRYPLPTSVSFTHSLFADTYYPRRFIYPIYPTLSPSHHNSPICNFLLMLPLFAHPYLLAPSSVFPCQLSSVVSVSGCVVSASPTTVISLWFAEFQGHCQGRGGSGRGRSRRRAGRERLAWSPVKLHFFFRLIM